MAKAASQPSGKVSLQIRLRIHQPPLRALQGARRRINVIHPDPVGPFVSVVSLLDYVHIAEVASILRLAWDIAEQWSRLTSSELTRPSCACCFGKRVGRTTTASTETSYFRFPILAQGVQQKQVGLSEC